MRLVKYEITGRIERVFIENICNALDELWEEDGDKLCLHIQDCEGGNFEPVIQLIDQVLYSKVPIKVTACGYVMSAAAYLYFKLLDMSDTHSFINVVIPEPPIKVVYHKPNVENQHSPDLLNNPEMESAYSRLVECERLTDELFCKIVHRFGWKSDKIKHDYRRRLQSYGRYENVEFLYPVI